MEGPHSTMLLKMVTGLFVNTFFETLITKVQKTNQGGLLLMLLLKMDILASAIIYTRQSKTDLQQKTLMRMLTLVERNFSFGLLKMAFYRYANLLLRILFTMLLIMVSGLLANSFSIIAKTKIPKINKERLLLTLLLKMVTQEFVTLCTR